METEIFRYLKSLIKAITCKLNLYKMKAILLKTRQSLC